MEDAEIETLKKFYSVETERELIESMDHHIGKLQAKLQELVKPEPAYSRVR